MTNVYLCGAITAVNDDGVGWREFITPALQRLGLNVLDPTKVSPDGLGEVGQHKLYYKELVKNGLLARAKHEFQKIIDKDLSDVASSQFVVCVYDPDIQLVGTIHELVLASQLNKFIVIYCDKSKITRLNPWILSFLKSDTFIKTDWNDVLNLIQKELK